MATLKDLAPAEKQKVAGLIKQAVEREAAIRELEAALGEARAAAAAAAEGGNAGGRAAALEEQNRGLALENTRWVLPCRRLAALRTIARAPEHQTLLPARPPLNRPLPPPAAACGPSCPTPLTCCAPTSTRCGCWTPRWR